MKEISEREREQHTRENFMSYVGYENNFPIKNNIKTL